jgi:hypothetical protein
LVINVWLKDVVLTQRAAASHKSGQSSTYRFCEFPTWHRTQLAKLFNGFSRRCCARKRRSFNFAFSSTRTFPTTRTAPSSSSKSSSLSSSGLRSANEGLAQAYHNCLDRKLTKTLAGLLQRASSYRPNISQRRIMGRVDYDISEISKKRSRAGT